MDYPTKTLLNSAAGGNLANKDSVEAMEMIEEMVTSQREWTADDRDGRRAGMHKVDEVTALQAKVEALQTQLAKLHQVKSIATQCGICGGIDHDIASCQNPGEFGEPLIEQVNGLFYDAGDKRNPDYKQNYSNNYNPTNRWNHPNFRWKYDSNDQGIQNQFQNRSNQYQNQSPDARLDRFEKRVEKFMEEQGERNKIQRGLNTDLADTMRRMDLKLETLIADTNHWRPKSLSKPPHFLTHKGCYLASRRVIRVSTLVQ